LIRYTIGFQLVGITRLAYRTLRLEENRQPSPWRKTFFIPGRWLTRAHGPDRTQRLLILFNGENVMHGGRIFDL